MSDDRISFTCPECDGTEMYVAGQAGVTLANDLFNVKGTGPNQGTSFSDTTLQDSVMYGAKLGYYFESMKWLGFETEVFSAKCLA